MGVWLGCREGHGTRSLGGGKGLQGMGSGDSGQDSLNGPWLGAHGEEGMEVLEFKNSVTEN